MPSTSFVGYIEDVKILVGEASTRAISAYGDFSDAAAIAIISPTALDAATYTLQVSHDKITWATLSDGTADIGPPAAGKARQYTQLLGFPYWRISATANAAGERVFRVWKLWIG